MAPILLAVAVLAVVLWQMSRRQRRRSIRFFKETGGGTNRPQRVPPRLMNELHRLTRDRGLSERLIERIAFNNPERSRRWCVEKAIYDLQRDRRS
ncbi:MAG: hypothetical protein HC812_03350 [Leptolyngbya sp. RL_3_1]|nr:hypothetical protein [Leptolyngbya sp. RL_3_1]